MVEPVSVTVSSVVDFHTHCPGARRERLDDGNGMNATPRVVVVAVAVVAVVLVFAVEIPFGMNA